MATPTDSPRRARLPRAGVTAGVLAGVVALVLVVALLTSRWGGSGDAAAAATPTPTPTATAEASVADVYEAVAASVVVVRTADGALGSGVVAADDGSILTADHVVADGSAITVTFADGTQSAATVAEADTATDVATLTPETFPEVLVPATVGGGVEIGADVIAIGNPLGLTLSVSTGVVSGLDRTSTSSTDGAQLTGLIQFDASVNPGSSGGPLLDADGVVVGIVVSIADPGQDGAFAGIGFAVPIGTALGSGGEGDGQGPQI
ncbi:S1C family serine protease [Cellulomonas soli]|uniref:Serine protease n=1 Tax=Cellulomonas soli TaxID=931535 RepID=A0A512PAP8_9CELL|nr:trypsin-like peptidase domain-containing protein [Cellulomonas soli]NYI57436.1 S1-C subfamily serine protease [Cellulomonas soli]GEP68283.1 hypothetical protein CSO01_09980 [Cellulomonas soli]